MRTNFLPDKESELVDWSNNFAAKLATMGTDVGLSSAQVTTFTGLNDAWIAAYGAYQNPTTRTKANLEIKNEAKVAMTANARKLVGTIQKFESTTNAQRADLRITIAKSRTPIPPPESAPTIKSIVVTGKIAKITIRGLDGDRRSRPEGVQGATVLMYVGEVPSDDITQWQAQGLATKTTFELAFPSSLAAGTQVWISAAWYTARGMTGPACAGVGAIIGGGPNMQHVINAESATKKAA